jgi:hypothetical protein
MLRGVAASIPILTRCRGEAGGLEFLNRARRMVTGRSPVESSGPQFYVVSCPEGHRLRGQRTEGYQALRCPTCGGGAFVLPRSPLPQPLPPAETKRRVAPPVVQPDDDAPIQYVDAPSPSTEFEDDEVEIHWLDDSNTLEPSLEERASALSEEDIPPEYLAPPAQPAPSSPSPPQRASRKEKRKKSRAASPADNVALAPPDSREPAPRTVEGAVLSPEERSILVPAGRSHGWLRRNRVALLLVGMLAVAGATIAYRLHRQRLERLPHEAETNYEEGLRALDDGEFDVARQKLARAASAFAQLGSRDERSGPAQQLAREAAIYADLCPRSLEELVDEAARTEPADWPRRFEVNYQGRAIIVDDVLIEASSARDASGAPLELSYRILVGRGPQASRTGLINLSGFKLFDDRPREAGEPVLFGARLDSVTLEGNQWHVRLVPDSGVLLSRFEPLKLLGWTPRSLTSSEPEASTPLARGDRRP